MALHAYSHSHPKRSTLHVVDSPRPVRALSKTQSAVIASIALAVPFLLAVVVLGAGR